MGLPAAHILVSELKRASHNLASKQAVPASDPEKRQRHQDPKWRDSCRVLEAARLQTEKLTQLLRNQLRTQESITSRIQENGGALQVP